MCLSVSLSLCPSMSLLLSVLTPCLCLHVSLGVTLSPLFLCLSLSLWASCFPSPKGVWPWEVEFHGGTSVLVLAKATSVNTGHPEGLWEEKEASLQDHPLPT